LILATVVLATVVPAVVFGGAGPAGAAIQPSVLGRQETFQNRVTGLCLTPESPTLVSTDSPQCGATPNRDYWDVNVVSNGNAVTLGSDLYVGRCITDNGGIQPAMDKCDLSNVRENWESFTNDNDVDFENEITGRCIDDSSLGLRMIGCNNLPYQYWG
jgi:hypothetical protein